MKWFKRSSKKKMIRAIQTRTHINPNIRRQTGCAFSMCVCVRACVSAERERESVLVS